MVRISTTAPASPVAARRWRVGLLGVTLVVVLLAAVAASLLVGSRAIGLSQVLGGLFGTVDSDDATVIATQRLPRTVLALVVGAALGLAGALMQGHTRNPLAEPGLFGVNAGAAFGIAVLVFGFGAGSTAALALAALLGAASVSTLVFVAGLGSLRGSALITLAVLGATASLLFGALTQALVLLDRQTLDTLRFWDTGSLAAPDTTAWPLLLPLLGLGAALAIANAFSLRALMLGDDVAAALGTRILAARIVGIAAITLLAGAATAACGPVGFVGLVAPYAVRWATGHDYRQLVPLAALAGAGLLLIADTVGRVVLPGPAELGAGITVALIGAPVLLIVVRRRGLVAL